MESEVLEAQEVQEQEQELVERWGHLEEVQDVKRKERNHPHRELGVRRRDWGRLERLPGLETRSHQREHPC
jgi:hypothetical protein